MKTRNLQFTAQASLVVALLLAPLADSQGADPTPATKKPAAGSSLDDELFQDLDLGVKKKDDEKRPDAKAGAGAKPPAGGGADAKQTTEPAKKPRADVKLNPLDAELLKDLEGDEAEKPAPKKPSQRSGGPGEGADGDNPLVRLSRQVRDAEARLRQEDSGDQTQDLQRKIVDDLERLIAQIEQQQQQQQQSKSQSQKPQSPQPGQPKPQQPKSQQQKKSGQQPADKPTDSGEQLANRKNEKPTTGDLKDLMQKVWGELPERQRQDVMQSSFDDFPVKYQYVIEEYFKTLLQRQD